MGQVIGDVCFCKKCKGSSFVFGGEFVVSYTITVSLDFIKRQIFASSSMNFLRWTSNPHLISIVILWGFHTWSTKESPMMFSGNIFAACARRLSLFQKLLEQRGLYRRELWSSLCALIESQTSRWNPFWFKLFQWMKSVETNLWEIIEVVAYQICEIIPRSVNWPVTNRVAEQDWMDKVRNFFCGKLCIDWVLGD